MTLSLTDWGYFTFDIQRATLLESLVETCDFCEWWGNMKCPIFWQWFVLQLLVFWQFLMIAATKTITRTILESYDIWATDYKFNNWEPEFMTPFVTWQLRVTLDSICHSCNILFLHHSLWCSSKLYAGHSKVCEYLHDKSSWMWCMYKTFVWYLNLHKIPLYSNCNFVWANFVTMCLVNHLDCVIFELWSCTIDRVKPLWS